MKRESSSAIETRTEIGGIRRVIVNKLINLFYPIAKTNGLQNSQSKHHTMIDSMMSDTCHVVFTSEQLSGNNTYIAEQLW